MPRIVYPFYISAKAEGRKSEIKGGTHRKDGSLTTHVYQRSDGEIVEPYTIRQHSYVEDDKLKLVTEIVHEGIVVHKYVTDY